MVPNVILGSFPESQSHFGLLMYICVYSINPIRLEFYVDNGEIMVQVSMGDKFKRKLEPRRICSQTRDEIAKAVARYEPRYMNYTDTIPIWPTLNRMEMILESITLSETNVKELRHYITLLKRMTGPGMHICSQRD